MLTTDLALIMKVLEKTVDPYAEKELVPQEKHHLLAYLLKGWEISGSAVPVVKDGFTYLDVQFKRKIEPKPEDFVPNKSMVD